jgi:MFS family permease
MATPAKCSDEPHSLSCRFNDACHDPSSSPSRQEDNNVKMVSCLLLVFNFFFAPVKDGLGVLVSVFLVASKGWDPGTAGVIWFTRDVSTMVCQTFVGSYVDSSERKRAILFFASVIASLTGISVAWTQNFPFLVVKSIFEGAAICFVNPCKFALILGLIGQKRFDQASKANEIADHSGSFFAIILAAVIAFYLYPELVGVFYIVGGGGLLACLSLVFMPLSIREDVKSYPGEILMATEIISKATKDDQPKRSLGKSPSIIDQATSRNMFEGETAKSYGSILKDRNIALFAFSVFFFHFGNAAILPLLSQALALESGKLGIPYTCANIAIAQLTSVFSVWAMGFALERGITKHKIPLLIGYFAGVPLRCFIIVMLQMYWPNRYALMSTQLLDGIGAGTFGLSLAVVTKALTVGSGRFSFTLSFILTFNMVGAALSNLVSGYIVTYTSYNHGFTTLGIMGTIAVLLGAFVNIPAQPCPTHGALLEKVMEMEDRELEEMVFPILLQTACFSVPASAGSEKKDGTECDEDTLIHLHSK